MEVRRAYDRLAEDYDERWTSYVRSTTREALRWIDLSPGERALDVGCGTGTLLASMADTWPGADLVGLDLSPAMCRQARSKLAGRVAIVCASVHDLPFPAGRFDLVVSTNALHFWREPGAALAEIGRALAHSGRLVLTDWCDDYLACRIADLVLRALDPAHHAVYGTHECARMLEEAGFRDVRIERTRIEWPWGLMTATARR